MKNFESAVLAVAAALFCTLTPAGAELIFSFKQTGSDVTATLGGTIDAAWGSPVSGVATDYGSLSNVSGGWTTYGAVNLRGGYTLSQVDTYMPSNTVAQFSGLAGSLLAGGVVQPGSSLTQYVYLDVAPKWYWIEVLPGTKNIGTTTIVWSNKLLSDFFSAGTPLLTDIYNGSSQKLMTLQIGEAAPVPEPGTWAAAALLLGGAGVAGWRKLHKVA